MSSGRRSAASDEGGAVTIIVALTLMVLLLGLSFAIDVGALRSDRRAGQATADFAALSAVNLVDPTGIYDPEAACTAAWQYVLANLADEPPAGGTPCTAFTGMTSCNAATAPIAATGEVGDYTITLRTPIPDGDPMLQGRLDPEVDGWSCERFAVTVARQRDHLIAGVTGDGEGSTSATSVIRGHSSGQTGEFASLIVLDRTGCRSLYTSGQGAIVVQDFAGLPGLIAVDSAGTAPGNSSPGCANANSGHVIDVTDNTCSGSPCSLIQAEGAIFSYAERLGAPGPGRPHDPCDVDQGTGAACNGKPIRVDPVPVSGPLVTRAPIDHRFNCKAAYPLAIDVQNPGPAPVEAIAGCEGLAAPHIDALVAAYGGTGSPAAGWKRYPADVPGASCAPNLAPIVVSGGPWWVDCPGTAGFRPGSSVTFTDPGVVVFEGGIELRNDAVLTVNPDAGNAPDSIVFVRAGSLSVGSQASLVLNHVTTYLARGTLAAGGGDGPITMTAPVGPSPDALCGVGAYVPAGGPPASCLEDLVLWSNAIGRHSLGGQAPLVIEGTVFTPNAGRPECSGPGCGPFRLTGQADQTLRQAQFISHRLEVAGQGIITMSPDADRTTSAKLSGGGLIR